MGEAEAVWKGEGKKLLMRELCLELGDLWGKKGFFGYSEEFVKRGP